MSGVRGPLCKARCVSVTLGWCCGWYTDKRSSLLPVSRSPVGPPCPVRPFAARQRTCVEWLTTNNVGPRQCQEASPAPSRPGAIVSPTLSRPVAVVTHQVVLSVTPHVVLIDTLPRSLPCKLCSRPVCCKVVECKSPPHSLSFSQCLRVNVTQT